MPQSAKRFPADNHNGGESKRKQADKAASPIVPTALVIRIGLNRSSPGAFLAVIECPYCVKSHSYRPRNHTHGIPPTATEGWAYRVAHCHPKDLARAGYTEPPSNYRFWVPAGALQPQEPRP